MRFAATYSVHIRVKMGRFAMFVFHVSCHVAQVNFVNGLMLAAARQSNSPGNQLARVEKCLRHLHRGEGLRIQDDKLLQDMYASVTSCFCKFQMHFQYARAQEAERTPPGPRRDAGRRSGFAG